jgi:hypothetical protein
MLNKRKAKMRELKYKAWHRDLNKMFWFDVMWGNFLQGGGHIGMVEWGSPRENDRSFNGNQTLIDPNNCDILEFTGQNDKFGKEICEGDICVRNGHLRIIIFQNASFQCVPVKKREDEIDIDHIKAMRHGWHLENFMSDIEVIGNVKENPELLKNKNLVKS